MLCPNQQDCPLGRSASSEEISHPLLSQNLAILIAPYFHHAHCPSTPFPRCSSLLSGLTAGMEPPERRSPFSLGLSHPSQCKVDVLPAGPDNGHGWISSRFSVFRKKCPLGCSPEDMQLQRHPFPLDGGGWGWGFERGSPVRGPTTWCPESMLDFILPQHPVNVSWVHGSAAS